MGWENTQISQMGSNPYSLPTISDFEDYETKFVNESGTFLGWNTKSNGTGDSYTPGDLVALTKDVRLYAQWGASRKMLLAPPVYMPGEGDAEDDIITTDVVNETNDAPIEENTTTDDGITNDVANETNDAPIEENTATVDVIEDMIGHGGSTFSTD